MASASLFRFTSWFLVAFILFAFASAAPVPDTASDPDAIPDHYIFVMKQNITSDGWQQHQNWSDSLQGKKKWVFNAGGFRGYCGSFSQATVAKIAASNAVYSS